MGERPRQRGGLLSRVRLGLFLFVSYILKKTGRAEGGEMRRFGKKILKIPKNFSKGYGQKRFYVVNYGKTDS